MLAWIAQGLFSQEAAERLSVSRRAVDFHLGNVYQLSESR